MKPSKLQQAIFDFIANDDRSLIIEAVAGSGKTTTICKCLEQIPEDKSVLFCAFNKSIAEELKERVPNYVNVMTMNGLGHRAWGRHVGGQILLNSNKTYDILTDGEYLGEIWDSFKINENRAGKLRSKVRRLVGIAKQMGIVPNGVEDAKGLVEDDLANWIQLIEHHDIDFLDEEDRLGASLEAIKAKEAGDREDAIRMARVCLKMGLERWNEIDFDDQLYMTVVFGAKVVKHDYVFVDEAQDISQIQRVLLKKALKRDGGRLVAVGDPHQAIYGFRGADASSLAKIQKGFNCVSLPLSISYRCPKAVVTEAQKFVSHIESAPTAPEGQVINLGSYTRGKMHETFQLGDFVVCRNTAPLVRCAFDLIRCKIPAKIMGRDIGQSLVTLVKRMRAYDIDTLIVRLEEWRKTEADKILKRDPDASIQKIEEKYECLMIFIESTNPSSPAHLSGIIEDMFSADDPKLIVTLATIHKAKGLESERVVFLDSFLLPSKYAKKEWQKEQERNLSYVAITRSKGTLVYMKSPQAQGKYQ